MKKIFTYFAIATLAGAVTISCDSDKEFLTEHPKAQFSIDNAYQSADQVISTMVAGYAQVKSLYFNVPSHLLQTDETGTFSAFGGRASTLYNWTTSQGKTYWDGYYKIIAYANQALYASELSSITWTSDAQKTQIQAEAKALRGFAHMRLAEYFGGVPIQSEYSETLRFDYQKSSRKEVYEFAIKDLKDAFEGLPDSQAIGRIGKGAAAIMLSEAYLGLAVEDSNNQDDLRLAVTYADECINRHALMTQRFGMRVASATGSNLGVPNALPDPTAETLGTEAYYGTAYSDLFYKQNPRNAANTEAVWVMIGAENYSEYSSNSSAVSVNNVSLSYGTGAALRDTRLTAPAGASADVVSYYAGHSAWPEGGNSDFYAGSYGVSVPAIANNSVPFGGCASWFAAVEVFDPAHDGTTQSAIKPWIFNGDDRGKEGVAVRRYYPVTDPNHPDYSKENETLYGFNAAMKGWEDIDKTNYSTAMEYVPVFDKMIPIDSWGYDENVYPSISVWGNNTFRDRYMYRSAEAYLLKAEAQVRQGNPEDAAKTINIVRARAHAKDVDASKVDVQYILDERCRELMFEEDRWATFLRQEPSVWKDRIYSYGYWTKDDSLGTLNDNYATYPTTQQFDYGNPGTQIKWNLWPLPKDYVDLNTDNPEGMAQNEGWSVE